MPTDEPRGRGVSLWWLPPPRLARRLQGLIDALSSRLGTPSFPPHVTVEGGLAESPEDLVARLSDAAPRLRAPRLQLHRLTTEPAWNRTLVLEVVPTDEVLDARLETCLALGRTVQRSAWRPHLSLVYGPLPDSTRARLAESLSLGPVPRTADNPDGPPEPPFPPFRPVALALVDTRGRVPEWWELQRWPLGAG